MEVKPGYKLTEVGVIPEDWDVDIIENIAHITTGGKNTQDRVNDGQYPFFVRSQTIERINSYSFDGEAVLTAGDGVGTGKVFHYINGKFDVHQRVYRISNFSERINGYYFFLYFSNHFYNRIMQMTAKSSVDSVRMDMIARMCVPLPPTEDEQRAIADALSDADALLAGLDQLIAKKRDLKQAAMQQLITGQTRLPGFSGEWEMKRLGDIFQLSTGKPKSAFVAPEGDYWICDMGSVSTNGQLIVSKRTNRREDFLNIGDLVMPKDDIGGGNIIGKVGYIDANRTYVLGDHVYRLIAREGDPRFLAYTINSHTINSALRTKVTGSAQLGLGRKSIEDQEIYFPSPKEQTAIADVLSDMDAELAALEARRDKTRDLKQGMMQELLTGKTRLVQIGDNHA